MGNTMDNEVFTPDDLFDHISKMDGVQAGLTHDNNCSVLLITVSKIDDYAEVRHELCVLQSVYRLGLLGAICNPTQSTYMLDCAQQPTVVHVVLPGVTWNMPPRRHIKH